MMFGVKPLSSSQSNSPRTNNYSNNNINYNNENNDKKMNDNGIYSDNNNIDSYNENENTNSRISLFNSLKNMAINAVNISSFSQIKNNNNNNNLTNINNKSLPILSCSNNSYESVEYQNNSLGSSINNSPAGIGGLGLSTLSINCSKVNTPRDFKGKMKDILFSSFFLDYFQLHFSFLFPSPWPLHIPIFLSLFLSLCILSPSLIFSFLEAALF